MNKLSEEELLDFLVEVIWGHMFSTPEEVCEYLGLKPTTVASRLKKIGREEWARPYYRYHNRLQSEKRKREKLR